MMIEFKQGDTFDIEYPFHNQGCGFYNGVIETMLTPGCHRDTEQEDQGWGYRECVYWTANFMGKIRYEVMSIAEMPGKYMNRVIVKYHYILPNGESYGRPQMKTLTIGKLSKQIESESVFPCEYEIDENHQSYKKTASNNF
jgi:hypothetical protein